MPDTASETSLEKADVVLALGEEAIFQAGDTIRIGTRTPVGHYRVPIYLRGKTGVVEMAIEPMGIDNEEEAYGRNAGKRRHFYRVVVPMREIWADYRGPASDELRIEVFETWLERI